MFVFNTSGVSNNIAYPNFFTSYRKYLIKLFKYFKDRKETVLEMKIVIYWSETNSWIYFYIVLNKLYWSWVGAHREDWKIFFLSNKETQMIGKILITYQLGINIRTNKTGLDSDNDRLVKTFFVRELHKLLKIKKF